MSLSAWCARGESVLRASHRHLRVCVQRATSRMRQTQFDANFRSYGRGSVNGSPGACRFEEDVRAGDLADYMFLEPRFLTNQNDMHPPVRHETDSSILAGELLLKRVYEALFLDSPKRNETLLAITFDEHGGCYDHVPPPTAVPPQARPDSPLQDGFHFDRLGVRVPAVFVSPWIRPRTVVRSPDSRPLSHTSMIRTICERWGLAPDHFTARDQSSPDVLQIFNADAPRQELPRLTPRPYVASEQKPVVDDRSSGDFIRNAMLLAAHTAQGLAANQTMTFASAVQHFAETGQVRPG